MPDAVDAALRGLAAARARASALLRRVDAATDGPLPKSVPWRCVERLLAGLGAPHVREADTFAALAEEQSALFAKLRAAGVEVSGVVRAFEAPADYAAQFDRGFEGLLGAGVVRGVRCRDGVEITVTGVAAAALDARATLLVAQSVLTSARQRPERPVVVLLDEGGGAADMDETSSLSEYLVHLTRAFAWAHAQSVAVNVWLYGRVNAASYVACAAGASRVIAFPYSVLDMGSDGVPVCAAWARCGLVDQVAEAAHRVGIAWTASA